MYAFKIYKKQNMVLIKILKKMILIKKLKKYMLGVLK